MSSPFLERIKGIVSPPASPIRTGDQHEWEAAEKALGRSLPIDYKEFLRVYGSGLLCGYIRIYNPVDDFDQYNFSAASKRGLEGYAYLKERHPLRRPMMLFPDEWGILPWGETTEGEMFYWLTNGPADAWPVCAFDDARDQTKIFAMNFTKFIYSVVKNSVELSFLRPNHSMLNFDPRALVS